jgi:hypothetical protein
MMVSSFKNVKMSRVYKAGCVTREFKLEIIKIERQYLTA